jgi:hypothetical protein
MSAGQCAEAGLKLASYEFRSADFEKTLVLGLPSWYFERDLRFSPFLRAVEMQN